MDSTMMRNGRLRKSLSEEIDRLDQMLDGLAEGLQDAITTAVSVAVQQAVREVLSNLEIVQQLQNTDSSSARRPLPQVDWKRRWAVVRAVVSLLLIGLKTTGWRSWQGIKSWGSRGLKAVASLRRFQFPVAYALSNAVAAGLAAVVTNSWVVTLVSGVGTLVGMLLIDRKPAAN